MVFTREAEVIGDIIYKSPLGKSDHVILEMDVLEGRVGVRDEAHKINKLKYGKTDFRNLRKYFRDTDWKELVDAESVQTKYDIFEKYFTEGVSKYVPKYKTNKWKDKEWFTRQCETARVRKEDAWNKIHRRNTHRK